MSRYFIVRNWSQEMPEEYSETPHAKVTVYDPEPVDTGLVSEDGDRIMKSMDAVGFLR